MTAYYLIKDNYCENCIESTLEKLNEFYPNYIFIERTATTEFDIGWTLINGVWIAPIYEQPSKVIQAYEFRDRFTVEEQDAILSAAYAGDIICRRVLLKLQTANDGVNLSSQAVIDGVNYLASIGVIASNRISEVLS